MILVILLAVQDDVEAKEKRLAELIAEAIELKEAEPESRKRMKEIKDELDALIEDLTGGDERKGEEIIDAAIRKHQPDVYEKFLKLRARSCERTACAMLKSFVTAQENFRSNDLDRNQIYDYWVADVSGLYRIVFGWTPIAALNDLSTAEADAAPAVPLDKEGEIHGVKLAAMGAGKPKSGYRYAIVKQHASGDKTIPYDDGNGRNAAEFAVCAFPAEYGVTGTLTFIVNENATVFQKDTEGKAPDAWPADPQAAGWKKVE
jgi:hypothetical protein